MKDLKNKKKAIAKKMHNPEHVTDLTPDRDDPKRRTELKKKFDRMGSDYS